MHALSCRAFHIWLVYSEGRRVVVGMSDGSFTNEKKENEMESVCMYYIEEKAG